MPIKKENYWIKPRKELLEYQIKFFGRELEREEKAYAKLQEGQEHREKQWQPLFKTWDELEEAYASGALKDVNWGWQRWAVWTVYSDRGHIARIEWLNKERDKYLAELQLLNDYILELKNDSYRRARYKARKRSDKGLPMQPQIDAMTGEEKRIAQEKKDAKRLEWKKQRQKRKDERKKQLKEREKRFEALFK